ncbi:VIP36-like protein isoform X1 [Megalops cyprinoides]|uniref:VIP36-like protein isoform X1 n=1 Tax=Megalops cyprinoides TaxID=118141 RepID=UPI0018645D74|nr:VIP36-like protein isoform X1 [Megalops cyprinoides]
MATSMTDGDLVWKSSGFISGVICCRNMFTHTHWILLFLLITARQCWGDEGYEMEEFLKREYSLIKPYQGLGSSSSSHWDLMGTAMITTDHVRLTPDLQSRQGAVWSRIPCYLRDWELHVHFKIHGQGKKNLNGDGLALWYTKERMQTGPVFGNMNLFTGLGVFVDTYPNEEKHQEAQKKYTLHTQRIFPYVSAMVSNGSLSYDHERDGRPTELGGCTAIVRNLNHDTFLLIRYARRRLTVMINIEGKQEWRDCLDVPGVRLPQGYFFGASSITGDLTDNHDLISLKLYQLTVPRSEQQEEEEEREEITIPSVDNMELLNVEIQEEGTSGVTLFFTVLFSLLGIFVLVVVGLVLYSRWKENSRKRFY